MKKSIGSIALAFAFVLLSCILALGQNAFAGNNGSVAGQIASSAGKVVVIVVKSAGKVAWETTKFTAKNVAKPLLVSVAKPLLLKSAPKASMFALKFTGTAIKKAVPIITKVGFAYLKAKLPI